MSVITCFLDQVRWTKIYPTTQSYHEASSILLHLYLYNKFSHASALDFLRMVVYGKHPRVNAYEFEKLRPLRHRRNVLLERWITALGRNCTLDIDPAEAKAPCMNRRQKRSPGPQSGNSMLTSDETPRVDQQWKCGQKDVAPATGEKRRVKSISTQTVTKHANISVQTSSAPAEPLATETAKANKRKKQKRVKKDKPISNELPKEVSNIEVNLEDVARRKVSRDVNASVPVSSHDHDDNSDVLDVDVSSISSGSVGFPPAKRVQLDPRSSGSMADARNRRLTRERIDLDDVHDRVPIPNWNPHLGVIAPPPVQSEPPRTQLPWRKPNQRARGGRGNKWPRYVPQTDDWWAH